LGRSNRVWRGHLFLIEGTKHNRWTAWFATVLGVIAMGYSIYKHGNGGSLGLPLWSYLLCLTWVLIGLDVYDRRVRKPVRADSSTELTVGVTKTPTAESLMAANEKKVVDELNSMTADEMKKSYTTDPDFVRRVEAIPKNKYRELPQVSDEPDRYIDTFQNRTMALSRELRGFLKELGPDPGASIRDDPREDTVDGIHRAIQASFPRTSKMFHGYERRFKDRVIDAYHETREHNLISKRFDELISRD